MRCHVRIRSSHRNQRPAAARAAGRPDATVDVTAPLAELIASYPELPDFLRRKKDFDPGELFQSTFYRALKALVPVA